MSSNKLGQALTPARRRHTLGSTGPWTGGGSPRLHLRGTKPWLGKCSHWRLCLYSLCNGYRRPYGDREIAPAKIVIDSKPIELRPSIPAVWERCTLYPSNEFFRSKLTDSVLEVDANKATAIGHVLLHPLLVL